VREENTTLDTMVGDAVGDDPLNEVPASRSAKNETGRGRAVTPTAGERPG
jgi:hypothetical protein